MGRPSPVNFYFMDLAHRLYEIKIVSVDPRGCVEYKSRNEGLA